MAHLSFTRAQAQAKIGKRVLPRVTYAGALRARSEPSSAPTGSSTAIMWRSHGCGRGATHRGFIGLPGRSTRHGSPNRSRPGAVGFLAARLHTVSKPRDPRPFRTGSGPACP
jgi:hypothetical protein